MGYLYVCDRTTLIAKGPKHVSSPHFWGVNLLLLVIGLLTLRDSGEAAAAKPLQRDQTEEWKGWMQIMFILYHYFAVRALSRDPTRRRPHVPTFPSRYTHLPFPPYMHRRRRSTTRSACTLRPTCG